MEFVTYTKEFLDLSSTWLSDPEIRQLTLTPHFDRSDQIKFFESLPFRTNYWIKGIREKGVPIGAMGLKNIDLKLRTAEYWGYIGEKSYWGKRLGKLIIDKAINKAVSLQLDSIYLKVGRSNMRAIGLYEKMGFTLKQEENNILKYELELCN